MPLNLLVETDTQQFGAAQREVDRTPRGAKPRARVFLQPQRWAGPTGQPI